MFFYLVLSCAQSVALRKNSPSRLSNFHSFIFARSVRAALKFVVPIFLRREMQLGQCVIEHSYRAL